MAVSPLSPDLPCITHITAIGKFLPGDSIGSDRLEDYLGMVGDRTTQVLALIAIASRWMALRGRSRNFLGGDRMV